MRSSVFPRCHLRLAVNLRWTCQLSSLITHRPTSFPQTTPRVPRKETPPFVTRPFLSSLAPVRIRNIWRSRKNSWSCIDGPLLCRRECPDLCHLPHGWADTVRHGWVWWDVAELQRRSVGLWTITGMWEQRREGLLSQLSPTHRGLSGDGDLSDHVSWFCCPPLIMDWVMSPWRSEWCKSRHRLQAWRNG